MFHFIANTYPIVCKAWEIPVFYDPETMRTTLEAVANAAVVLCM